MRSLQGFGEIVEIRYRLRCLAPPPLRPQCRQRRAEACLAAGQQRRRPPIAQSRRRRFVRPDQKDFALIFGREIGNRLGKLADKLMMDLREFADDHHDIGAPARLAGRNGHRAFVGKKRDLPGNCRAIGMIVCRANPLSQRDRRPGAVYIRIQAENRAPA